MGIRLRFNEERLVSAAQDGMISSQHIQDFLAPTYKVLGPEQRWKTLLDPLHIVDLGISAFSIHKVQSDSRKNLEHV